jgi:glycosylphosphatidylinositol phospholipase D
VTPQLGLLGVSVLVAVTAACSSGGGDESGEALAPGEYTITDVATHVIRLPDGSSDELGAGQRLAIGDIDGDGSQDLVVGIPGADGPGGSRPDAGAVIVVKNGEIKGNFELEDRARTVIHGAAPGDNLGFAVALGDLNGDGLADIVASAINANGVPEVRTDMGEAYVLFGGGTLAPGIDLAKGEYDVVIQPAEGFSHLGTSLAVGDLDGDDIRDLAVGAPYAGRAEGSPVGSARTTNGEVYVFRGGATLPGRLSVADGDEYYRMKGTAEFDQFGQSVIITDLDGDRSPDIVVGAPGHDPSGSEDAGAVFGFRLGDRGVVMPADSAQWTLYGDDAGSRLGSVVVTDPTSGDRLLVSAPTQGLADRPGCGMLYLAVLQEGVTSVGSMAGDSVAGSSTGEYFPAAIGNLADGRLRLITGSPGADSGTGALFLLGEIEGEADMAAPPPGTTKIAGGESSRLGLALSSGDIDGDGHSDLAVLSMPGAGQTGGNSGSVYLLEP